MSAIFSSRALLALQTVAYLAYQGRDGQPIKSGEMIDRYSLSKRALEPVLQSLSRAGIVESKQGANGGYTLVAPERTTLADVAALFMEAPQPESLAYDDLHPVLLPVMQAGHEGALESLRIPLSAIAEQAAAAGIPRHHDTPLDFII